LLAPNGILMASTNAVTLEAEHFVDMVRQAVLRAGRQIARWHYAPPPPDFPAHRQEPPSSKTVWLRLDP
jgi:23S rRNA G2069 N7-methylase RlmK/C1962 C5-methylase RlmI